MELGHHGHRAGDGHRALPQVSANESAHDDAAERAAHSGHVRRGKGPIQKLQQGLPQADQRLSEEGSVRASHRQNAAQT